MSATGGAEPSGRGERRLRDVLLVEDRPSDAQLTQDAFLEAGFPVQFHVVGSGEEALAFLRRRPPHAQAPKPDLILLDLALPLMTGYELLASLKGDEALRRIATVVVSSDESDAAVQRCYDLSVSSYLVKQRDWAAYTYQIRALATYWFTVVRLPER